MTMPHLALLVLLVASWVHAATLTITRGQVGEMLQATVETASYTLTIDATSGARVTSLTDKHLGVEITRRDDTGLGGLFEDRPAFSTARYVGAVLQETETRIVLRFSASNADGVSLTKTYEFSEGRPDFVVRYELQNASQLPYTLWVRNFATPGGGELTEADRTFLRHQGKLLELTFPDAYYPQPDNPWLCALDTRQACGYFVRCDSDLLDRFYFWSQSHVIPTFEWIYRPVPAGMRATTSLRFGLVSGMRRAEDVTIEGQVQEAASPAPEPLREPKFARVEGWRPVEDLYQPTTQERERGFIATVSGTKPPKPRLERLRVDLGLDEREAVPVEVFALDDEVTVTASVTGNGGDGVGPRIALRTETDGWLQAGNEVTLARGHYGRLWLTVDSTGLKPGQCDAEVHLSSGHGQPLTQPLTVCVWDARLPTTPNFGIQMYALVPTLSSYDLDEAAKRRFLVYMDNLQELRVDSLDWGVAGHYPAMRVTVKGTGQLLSAWSQQHPNIKPQDLPDIEFGYFDVWFEEPVKRNMTRFIAHVPSVNNWREAAVIKAALGRDVDPNSEEGWQVLMWYYTQLKRYAAEKGFTTFWAKLDDEIPQEQIPVWNATARRFQAIGWKTYTTNTGNIARSAKLLNDQSETSDAWQVALCLSRDFINLTRKGAAFEPRREICTLPFGRYTNGGAVDTWATSVPFFAGEKAMDRVEQIQVYADGIPLTMRDGSGWGNKDRGVAHVWAGHPYVCLPDGGDPNHAKIELSYRLRTITEDGPPAVRIKPEAEVWYYGGGSYRSPYEATRAYPWRVCAFDMDGYGFWTYLWWNGEDILVKLDPQTNALVLSAAWEGLRDGNEDAAYFRVAEERLQARGDPGALQRLRAVFGQDEDAPLRMGEVKQEVYRWDDFLAPTFAAYNEAKRRALEVLAERE